MDYSSVLVLVCVVLQIFVQHAEALDCGPGTFNSGTSCDPCDIGEYQALSFQTDCDSCVAGQTTMATGSTSSTDCIADCTAGTYRAADESGCLPCPENTYQPDTLQTDCIRCPVNLLAPPGSDNLVDCVGRCPTDMDIVFLVDASTSISYAEFNFVIIFLINTISNFVVGSDATRVGIIEFADDVLLSPRLDLVGSTDREVAIQAAITLIQGVVPGTNTAAGFQAANQMLANQGRVGIAHHIIVITDGKSDNFLQTVQQANEAKMSFRYITSIGVGDKIFERGLREIATDDSSFIKVDSFFSLLTTDILDDICIDTFSCLEQMDLYIIRHVDSTENGNIDAFLTSLQASYTMVNTEDVDSGATTDKLTADLAAVPVSTGVTSRAKVVVIFTDKPTAETGVDAAAQSLMDAGYVISVIYIDVATADSTSFDGIRTSESLMFQTENFYMLPYNQFIIRSLCIAPCPAGEERVVSGTCTPCEVGWYRDATQSHVCVPCPITGQYTLDTGSTSATDCLPTTCNANEFTCANNDVCVTDCCVPSGDRCDGTVECSDSSDESGCNFCTAGQYFDTPTEMCVDCVRGTYQPTAKSTSCLRCPDGTTTAAAKTTASTDCSVICDESGKELVVSDGTCTSCPQGSYRDKDIHARCVPCRDQFTTPAAMAVSQSQCVPDCPGGQRWNTVLDTCVDCLPGEYQPAQYQYDCLLCPDGTTSTVGSSSDSQCTDPCPAGSELPPGGTSVADCDPCEVGTYKDGTGTSTTCVPCPGGWTTAGVGSTDDTYCIPPCVAGQKLDSVTNQCVDCSLKTYQDEDHQTSCKPCPDGKTTTVAGANSVADCTDICAPGSELPASGTVIQDCVLCEPGFYKDNSGTTSTCQPCDSGYTTEDPGSTTETACIRNCPAGTRIEGVACVQCAIGFYQPDVRQTACIDCGTGRSTVSEGSTSVTQCIDVCNSGSELLQRDPLQCSFCEKDTYRVKDEQLMCVDCPDNHITVDVGATSLAECLPDCVMGERYDVATLSCQSCTAGTFQPLKYQDSCIDCPTGHTTPTAGATSLSECVYNCQGGSRWEPALGRCVPCTVNEYQPLQYQAACLPCPDGTTTEIEGSTSLNDCHDPCVPGEVYNPAVGLGDPSFPRCDTCPRDTYKGTGDSTCQACPEGYITDSTGSTSISACKPPCVGGTYWDGSILSCRPCAVGTYQAAPHQTSCIDCPAGTSTPGPGSTDLAQCIVPTCSEATEWECDSGPQCITLGNDCDGTLHCGDGSDETDINCCDDGEARSAGTCDQCPAGTYRTRRVHATCQDCPPDFTTIDPGQASQASCIPNCLAGYRYNGAACVPCPIGTYQDLPYQTSCTDCSAGLTTTNSGSTSASLCIDTCASGTERLSPTGTCTPCPKGSYRTQNADALCVTCPNSQTTVADGSGTSVADCVPDCSPGMFYDGSDCTPCVRGQYQPQPYQDSCRPCPTGRNTVDPGADTQALCIDPCSSGLEYNEVTDDCDVCPAGKYREQNVNVACTSCPDVLTTLLPGAPTVDYCIPSCTEGHFYNAAGPSCDNCAPGTYQDQQHQTACIPCPPGTFSSTQGATQASQCLDPCGPGEELIADGQGTNCQPCPLGYFKTATDILCQICTPAGFTTPATSAVDASECVPPCTYGYEWNVVVCTPCNYGTYQENQYSYACEDCEVGLSTADLGSDHQDDCIDICPSGLDLQFNRECLACKKNYYRTQFVHRQCQACPGNFFTIFDGATSLDQCLPMCDMLGTHWDEATGQCILCAVGYYQDERYQTMCKSCGTGRTTVNVARTDKVTGATSISQCAGDCVEGMKWDGTSCVLCERDTYQDKPYRDVCKACLPGYITVDTGSTLAADCIDPCENGRTWDGSTCVPCGLNQFRDREIHNLCQECDPGFITDTTTAMSEAECKPDCPEGTSWSGVLQVCIPCSVGFYQPARYQYSCMECPPTMTTTAPGAIVCVSTGCNAGEFRCVAGTPQCILEALLCDGDPTGTPHCADSSDEVNCNLCPAGQEYADASSMCVVCPIGTYKATASTEPCTTCPTGFTTANTESTSLSDCQPDCAEGYRYDVVTGVCVSCPTGTYQDLPYQYTCIPCMAGKTTTAPMSTSNSDCIDICNAGKELAADGVSCVDCVTGWYKGASGLATCQRCSDGFTTEGPGATQCIPACPPGQRRNSADTGCVVCEMGTYQDEGLQTSCKTCPAGTSTHTAGATTCHDVCSDGFELQTDGTCKPCPRGTYRTMMTDMSKVQATCIACDTGYTTETIGQPSADRCVPDCAPGTFDASVTSVPFCSPCPQGQYQNLAYQTTCKLCPVWKTTAAPGAAAPGADNANDCYDPCDSGVEYDAVTRLCSHDCLRGRYRQKDVDAVCVPCDPGLTTVTVRSGSPNDCVPNCSEGEEFYAITGVPECRICGVNTHQPTPYSFTCIDCDGDRPISPPVTGVLTAADRVLCIGNCAPGEMWNYVTELCNWCNLGFYGAHAGQITCTACPTDMTTLARFSTSINACIPDCSENEYWNVGSQTCDACPTTQFQPAVRPHAETSCNNNPCTAGTRYDMPVCVPCTGATYQPQSGQMQCLTCPASAPLSSSDGTKCKVSCTSGMMWLSTSATTGSCQPCPAGQHQPSAGADACIPCPQAWYQNEVGKTMCKMCPNDFHTRTTGADSVNDCQADWCTAGNIYQTATATCVPCGYGYYRRPQVDATCIQCPAGKTTTSPTASSPASCVASCPAGRYWNKWRNTCCRCPKGFYQPQPGQASCQPCPSGKTTKRVGCTTVLACYDPCRSGYQYMDCKCLPCPGGLYKKRSVSSTCVACPPDTTTFVEGATDISKCTAVPCTQCIDLVIAVDMSRSLTKLEFYAVRHYLQSFVQKFRVSRLCTRIGIYAYAGGLRKIRQLHEGVNQRQLSYHLMKSLTPSDSSEVNTELALQRMKAMIIDEGRSSGVPKHGLLITDGGTNDIPAAQTVADMLRDMGINLSVISANPSEIALAAQSSDFYHITDYLHLTPIQNIVQGICGG